MADFFEVEFHDVHRSKSGDAITIRYGIHGMTSVHVVDGGYTDTGEFVANHINKYYGQGTVIDHVVATHNDSDHTAGLFHILEHFPVSCLWINRPWLYADELLSRFPTYTSTERLYRKLRTVYSNLAELEDLANALGIEICEPLQGEKIGEFTVLAPSRERFLDMVVASEKTPESRSLGDVMFEAVDAALKKAVNLVRAAWGDEVFSPNETSAENDMSVVQIATLNGKVVLLTGDAGRGALSEAANFASTLGYSLPGVDYIQIPHHGSRRNVDSTVLDQWLGERLELPPPPGSYASVAIVSAAVEDADHPRRSVVRAFIHRGALVLSTGDGTGTKRLSMNAPRSGWAPAKPLPYPDENED